MNIKFIQTFGVYQRDSIAELPHDVASTLIRVGVAEDVTTPETPVSTTEIYKSRKKVMQKSEDAV